MLCGTGLFAAASAQTTGPAFSPATDSDTAPYCGNMGDLGFTTSLVLCIQTEIQHASKQLIGIITPQLSAYEYAAILLAITLFGLRILTLSAEHMVKETFIFVVKIAFALSLIAYAANGSLYDLLSGGMGTMLSWVANAVTFPNGQCPFLPLPGSVKNPSQYIPWQTLDCLFTNLTGEAKSGLIPLAGTTMLTRSFIAIIGAALLTSTIGVFVTILGITAILALIVMVARAIYVVLLAYFDAGFF